MPAGQFKTHCLSVIDEVYNRGEEVVITKHGKPMARLIPLDEMKKAPDEDFWFHARQDEDYRRHYFASSPDRRLGFRKMIMLDTHVVIWLAG